MAKQRLEEIGGGEQSVDMMGTGAVVWEEAPLDFHRDVKKCRDGAAHRINL